MTPPPDESDALTVAKWCWPTIGWRPGRHGDINYAAADCNLNALGSRVWSPLQDANDANCAERVLIERGLASAYGKALLQQDGIEIHYCDSHSMSDPEFCAESAKLATASLDARVRAMAAVVRAQTEAKT
jgi:hypothetical protein